MAKTPASFATFYLLLLTRLLLLGEARLQLNLPTTQMVILPGSHLAKSELADLICSLSTTNTDGSLITQAHTQMVLMNFGIVSSILITGSFLIHFLLLAKPAMIVLFLPASTNG